MRKGKQLNRNQRIMLSSLVCDEETIKVLKSIGDLKALGIDGYGSKFFKHSWKMVEEDVMKTVKGFFERGELDYRFNKTLVTLIPKHDKSSNIKEYRLISSRTTMYNIISKVMSNRINKVLGSIISKNQAAFVPGQKIHDHVLIDYELVRGYRKKMGYA
ncbi:unnamed protein product [Vicia faba]|uniref:Reverse transcriptase domain-containing protein n=1 Tax=Vicia faba TaxID=3906 RepID=A0AAV1AAH5_VICFA|nr:unnamed protein product [Vicia faba]